MRRALTLVTATIFLGTFFPHANARADTSYAFIVAGHAYGAHSGGNLGLHPKLLNSLDSGYDSLTAFIVFTGDVVYKSTAESWQQVDDELAKYALPYYYSMGNHDDNDIGYQIFENKFGSTYYSFHSRSELFIVLNSTEQDRSISPQQLSFLSEQINLAGDTIRNIFIFFHEVLWNSHEKYTGVKSNSRSRYDKILPYSNYWEEVHPMLLGKPDKNFYVIAGDVGGNPDAIAAFYDTWDNVTLLASGMGEVADENYMLVRVHGIDSVEFELIPLDPGLNLPPIGYFSVPPAVDTITGPEFVPAGSNENEYSVPQVFNADSYLWELPEGASGTSTSNLIRLDFTTGFTMGAVSVRASREGFGHGPAASKMIMANNTAINPVERSAGSLQLEMLEDYNFLTIGINRINGEKLRIRLVDNMGRIIFWEEIEKGSESAQIHIDRTGIPGGIVLLSVSTNTRQSTRKIVLR